MWKIRDVEIKNQVVVAPMAGISNSAFRVICKEFGAGMVVCEMISDRGIIHNNAKTLDMLYVDPVEHPMSIQVFGGSKETLVQAAKFIDQNTQADIIDINMGCPVPKVVKTDAGARWLLDPNKIYEMVSAVVDVVNKPVTVKMRTGWDEEHIYAVSNALAAERAGASALAMHGRTRKQMYTGKADWNILKQVNDALTIPFIGNGDVVTPQDAKRMLDEVGSTAVMVGRAALGNPWIIKDMEHYLETGELLPEQTPREKVATAKEQLTALVELKGEKIAVPEFRRQAAYYLKGVPRSTRTRAKINEIWTQKEVYDLLDQFVEKYEAQEQQRAQRATTQEAM
ncbi:tRNA-dihydrouridine synthase [Amylolactobacillus amylotrophicus DSM 20534]|uniref:tRNA-dihydrouridine synthase n=3 Tax=Amylolactobacillus TaxID=2767876 RepID=A0A0R1YSQ6_9LACO|nr:MULTISPECIES: tRNA dihydrouridine synthase DusB [Amylolactobacillus]APT18219.1 tRNA dihydrouridine synthase DusB [Amylolactobacillus amylophilus DSM 20533 = JCM 1125]KRK37992.1 tRNA-dihydrouridine synthase [Amylolactobacillus amylotrophicus DSM 20534]KRM42252.1 tRNA-dihydrouridine synthase [Amylolactobacillus amylophilus DSM 20533 = JCM 1125]GED80193.1 tRNA-dihydrouridine synthase [Amylolactobacillus amylophilus]